MRRWWNRAGPAATALIIVAVAGFILAAATHLPFAWAFLLIALALIANGFLATLEDDLPGGFNNPDGTGTPRYARVVLLMGRWSAVGLLLMVAVLMVGAALVGGVPRSLGVALGVAALMLGVAIVCDRPWAIWGAAAIILAGLGAAVIAR